MLARLARVVPALRLVPGLPSLFDAVLLAHTALFHPKRLKALHEVEQIVLSWPGVTTKLHRFGGTEFRLGNREIGHLHGNGLLDIPYSKVLRHQMVQSGNAQPHHLFPRSNWISFYIISPTDVPNATTLLRLNYERWLAVDTPNML